MNKTWIVKAIVGFAALFILAGYIVMLLWNWLLPEIAGLKEISLVQAWGLLLLSKILFSSGGGGWKGNMKKAWKNHWQEKYDSMTPEEREEFRKKWAQRCNKWKEMEEK